MPELGNKHDCYSCSAKFYDLGAAEAVCPKCGANQKDAAPAKPSYETGSRRKKRDEPTRKAALVEDADEAPESEAVEPRESDEVVADVDLDEEVETPEGEEDEDDLDDDE